MLIPPHTAPLDMMYFYSSKLPMLDGKLLMSWHGYRVVGNRLVAYDINEQGLPLLTEQAYFNRDPIAPATEFTNHAFAARGGMAQQAQHQEVIGIWNKVDGIRPEGAPVGLLKLADETLLIVDDKNQALLRLAPGEPYLDGEQVAQSIDPEFDLYSELGQQVNQTLTTHCAICHQPLVSANYSVLNTTGGWLRQEGDSMLIEQMLFNDTRPMPPTNSLDNDDKRRLIDQLEQLINK